MNDKFILCVMHVINHPDIVRCRSGIYEVLTMKSFAVANATTN